MKISIVIPVHNEQDNLAELHRRVVANCETAGVELEMVLVDDGSKDRSFQIIRELAVTDPRVVGLSLSRNFGHEAASTAGLDYATGDAAILMDADLQDPPEVIPQMVELWKQGNHIVYGVRRSRDGETAAKRFTSWLFYRLLNRLADVSIPEDAGDFRLMDRKVLDALKRCREQSRFMRALISWTGFKAAPLQFDRQARHSGLTNYRFFRLFFLSLDAFVGFSIAPLRIATALGMLVTVFSLVMVVIIVFQKLFHKIDQAGYALQTTALFFIGGVQMMMLGVLGEYIGRIYRQSQNRPLYLVSEQVGGRDAQ